MLTCLITVWLPEASSFLLASCYHCRLEPALLLWLLVVNLLVTILKLNVRHYPTEKNRERCGHRGEQQKQDPEPLEQNRGTGRCLLLENTCLQSLPCTHHSLK